MEEKYFKIYNSDGDTHIKEMTKKDMLKFLKEQGEENQDIRPDCQPNFMSEIPDSDTNYWKNGILLIKGHIVIPKANKVVTEYDID